MFEVRLLLRIIFTPHAQREQGKVIGVSVHTYVCGPKQNFESYFCDRLTIPNIIHGRTSRRIYGLALPLLSP